MMVISVDIKFYFLRDLHSHKNKIMIVYEKIFNEEESDDIYNFLIEKDYEYHKPYMRFGKIVKVPRGQASYTLNKNIHYDYGISGGSPINEVMCDRLKEITKKVNKVLSTNFNTILYNIYKDGTDTIGWHKDKEKGWEIDTGVATLSFGADRDFGIKEESTSIVKYILHQKGHVVYLPYPMNHNHLHGIPKRMKIKHPRISLTFREIVATIPQSSSPSSPPSSSPIK